MTSPTRTVDEIGNAAAELAALRDAATSVLGRSWSTESFRALLDAPEAFDEGLWDIVLAAGWPDVLVSEAAGGGGGTLAQLCALAETAGRFAAPVPLAATAAAAWTEDRAVDGMPLVLTTTARRDGATASGSWPVVDHGARATRLLVLAQDPSGVALGVVEPDGPGCRRERVTPLDHNPAAAFTLQDAPLHVLVEGDDAIERHRAAVLRFRLARTAELVGVADAASTAATTYACQREAFGKPIGAFQAIAHRLVDARCDVEMGRALVTRAASAVDENLADADAQVALAAFWGVDRLRAVPQSAAQVFGGIGYTWEHEMHVHLRRAACAAAELGSRAELRAPVVSWLRTRHARRR